MLCDDGVVPDTAPFAVMLASSQYSRFARRDRAGLANGSPLNRSSAPPCGPGAYLRSSPWPPARLGPIDVRHTLGRRAISEHDAIMTYQELPDVRLVMACAGFDD